VKKIVVFTGSGISAESGIRTFRDSGGLWEEYDIMEVATPQAWDRNPGLVQGFYNKRRKQILEASPNAAHIALKRLEERFNTVVITQNIDDLHERAGSSNIIHLHGLITMSRSSRYPHLTYPINGWELGMDEVCEKGFPLRPHIVWFGEEVPEMDKAAMIVSRADIFIVIGTSLEVYPAAGLVNLAPEEALKFIIDPNARELEHISNLTVIRENAGTAVPKLVEQFLK
jgi:NAD-dependent deacetylase